MLVRKLRSTYNDWVGWHERGGLAYKVFSRIIVFQGSGSESIPVDETASPEVVMALGTGERRGPRLEIP
ncbi:MAG: hypothetical protein CL908_16150 [Deltaproteobacteria bacterium]|nr:hypothetical protein [Deltaproteobacteria bacterium]